MSFYHVVMWGSLFLLGGAIGWGSFKNRLYSNKNFLIEENMRVIPFLFMYLIRIIFPVIIGVILLKQSRELGMIFISGYSLVTFTLPIKNRKNIITEEN